MKVPDWMFLLNSLVWALLIAWFLVMAFRVEVLEEEPPESKRPENLRVYTQPTVVIDDTVFEDEDWE